MLNKQLKLTVPWQWGWMLCPDKDSGLSITGKIPDGTQTQEPSFNCNSFGLQT
jgi:hypothetical protein